MLLIGLVMHSSDVRRTPNLSGDRRDGQVQMIERRAYQKTNDSLPAMLGSVLRSMPPTQV